MQRYAEALEQFRAAERIKPHPVTSYNIAFCEAELGMPASAYRDYVRALASDTTRLPAEYVDAARRRADDAATRVARVNVSRAGTDSALRVDGHAVELVAFGARAAYVVSVAEATPPSVPASLELWLDPGEHVFAALGASGETLFEDGRVVGSGSFSEVVLAAPPPVSVGTPAPAPPRLAPPSAVRHRRNPIARAPPRTAPGRTSLSAPPPRRWSPAASSACSR